MRYKIKRRCVAVPGQQAASTILLAGQQQLETPDEMLVRWLDEHDLQINDASWRAHAAKVKV